jgi:hypothetical protein
MHTYRITVFSSKCIHADEICYSPCVHTPGGQPKSDADVNGHVRGDENPTIHESHTSSGLKQDEFEAAHKDAQEKEDAKQPEGGGVENGVGGENHENNNHERAENHESTLSMLDTKVCSIISLHNIVSC